MEMCLVDQLCMRLKIKSNCDDNEEEEDEKKANGQSQIYATNKNIIIKMPPR